MTHKIENREVSKLIPYVNNNNYDMRLVNQYKHRSLLLNNKEVVEKLFCNM